MKHIVFVLAPVALAITLAPQIRVHAAARTTFAAYAHPRAGHAVTLAADRTPAPTAHVLSPFDVVTLAGTASNTAVQARTDSAVVATDIMRVHSAWWPRITASALYTARDNPPEVGTRVITFPIGQQNNGQYDIRARQLLFDGGRRGLASRVAHERLQATRAASRAGIQSAQLRALDRYVTALSLAARVRVVDQRLEALEEHRRTVSDLYDQGIVSRNDLLETAVRVDEVHDARASLVDRRAVVLADLSRLLGGDPDNTLALPDSLPASPAFASGRTLDAWLQAAATHNATVRAAAAGAAAANNASRLARRARWPQVFAEASHSWLENETFVHEFVNSVAVGVSWNLFDGGMRAADVAQADARRVAARRARTEAARAARVGVRDAWQSWRRALREHDTAQRNVSAARENLRIVEDQYRAGVARSSDVLDAEALLADRRFAVVQRHHDAFLARARLAATAGTDLATYYASAPPADREN